MEIHTVLTLPLNANKKPTIQQPCWAWGGGVTVGDKILAPFTELGESKANK